LRLISRPRTRAGLVSAPCAETQEGKTGSAPRKQQGFQLCTGR
jgi:hypothetical protein